MSTSLLLASESGHPEDLLGLGLQSLPMMAQIALQLWPYYCMCPFLHSAQASASPQEPGVGSGVRHSRLAQTVGVALNPWLVRTRDGLRGPRISHMELRLRPLCANDPPGPLCSRRSRPL